MVNCDGEPSLVKKAALTKQVAYHQSLGAKKLNDSQVNDLLANYMMQTGVQLSKRDQDLLREIYRNNVFQYTPEKEEKELETIIDQRQIIW